MSRSVLFALTGTILLAAAYWFAKAPARESAPPAEKAAPHLSYRKKPSDSLPPETKKTKTLEEKALEAAVDNVFDGPNDPAAFRLLVNHIWKEDDLCLATVLLDYRVNRENWNLLFTQMFKEKSESGLKALLNSFQSENRGAEILAKLGSSESLAEPLLYAQFAFTAWESPERFEKILQFLEKATPAHADNGAFGFLSAVAAAEAKRPDTEIEGHLNSAFSGTELNFGLAPFYERLAEAAGKSAVNFLAMKRIEDFSFAFVPTSTLYRFLLRSRFRTDLVAQEKGAHFGKMMEEYGAGLRDLSFGGQKGIQFFTEGRFLRYLFEHPNYGIAWQTEEDYNRGRLSDVDLKKAELESFNAPIGAKKKAFDAVANETVEDRTDQCARGDFDAFFTEWKRARASGPR